MIVIGVVLLVLGAILGLSLLFWLGLVLAVAGAVLWISGHRVY